MNSKEKAMASEISLSKDVSDMKACRNQDISVLKPYLFVLVCFLVEPHENLKVFCIYLFIFSKLELPNWGCCIYTDLYGILVLKKFSGKQKQTI